MYLIFSLHPDNIINTPNQKLYLLIRTTLMKYFIKDNSYTYPSEDIMEKFIKHLTISHLRVTHPYTKKAVLMDVRMYGCPTRKLPNSKKIRIQYSYNWRLAAATTSDSLFILSATVVKAGELECQTAGQTVCQATSKTAYQIVALVKNLYPKFISFLI